MSRWAGKWRPALRLPAAGITLASAMLGGCATTPPPIRASSEVVVDFRSNRALVAQIRGRTLRLNVDPGAPYFVLLNDTAARELGLVATKSATLAVGPMRLKGKTRSERLTIGGVTASIPVMWVKGHAMEGADGVINPASVPSDRVTIRLGTSTPAEREIRLAMRFDRQRGLYHELDFGGQLIFTRLTLLDKLTTTTGAAASIIAKRRDGAWNGAPFVHPIRFGVPRPVRRMSLGDPLMVGGFSVDGFAVRIQDDRGSYLLPARELPSEDAEDGERIVVTGKNRRNYGAAHFWLMIGAEDLSRCSSVTYAREARELMLSCASDGSRKNEREPI